MLRIFQAETSEHIVIARELMIEYAQSLGFSLCFQAFDQEIAQLPGDYAPPAGRLLLATWENKFAGVIAMRQLKGDRAACEMKRLFVRPEFRGHAIGLALVQRLISEARQNEYSRMVLDTVPGKMDKAITLYRDLGFREIPPYYHNPVGAVYLELILRDQIAAGNPQ